MDWGRRRLKDGMSERDGKRASGDAEREGLYDKRRRRGEERRFKIK